MSSSTATQAQQQQALFTGCGVCGGQFCMHGRCRVCGKCEDCDRVEQQSPRVIVEREAHAAEQKRLRDRAALRRQALADLDSKQCLCGSRKREQESFCRTCYFKVPAQIRSGLYASFANGYLDFWLQAVAHLKQIGRIPAEKARPA
jgi:hypothetical protein